MPREGVAKDVRDPLSRRSTRPVRRLHAQNSASAVREYARPRKTVRDPFMKPLRDKCPCDPPRREAYVVS